MGQPDELPGWRVVLVSGRSGYGVAVDNSEAMSGERALSTLGAMHATDTVDVVVVLSGELVVRLAGGPERTVRAGDTLIQNGLQHAWANRSPDSATIATIVIGANPVGSSQ